MVVRVGRRLSGGGGSACSGTGPSGAAAVRTPTAAEELQPGLRAPRGRWSPGTGDPSGNRSPPELAGREPALPGAAAATPPWLIRGRPRAPDSGSGIPALTGAQEALCPGRLRSVSSRCLALAPRRDKVVDVSR